MTTTLQLLKDKCPECESRNLLIDRDTGETVCGDCGLVIQEDLLDEGPEWRAFTREEKQSRSRVGNPASYSVHDKGLTTTISKVGRDASGRKLPLSTRYKMWRLRRWQIRSSVHSSIERNLAQAMTEIDRLANKVSLPRHVKEKAAIIYRKALDKGLVRGRSIAAIAAGSLYAACRITGTPRNLREVSRASLVRKKDVARSYRLIIDKLGIRMPTPDPKSYLTKIAQKAKIPVPIQTSAVGILNEAKRKHALAGKDPLGIAAAALYMASMEAGKKRTQKEIADAAGVTEVTVRNRYKALKKQLDLEYD